MSKKLPVSTQPANFETAMTELSVLVSKMETGELALEESLSAYQRGAELIKYCAVQLEKVEQQVKFLDADMLKPFATDQLDAASGVEKGTE